MKPDVLAALFALPYALEASERSRQRRNDHARELIAPPPSGTPLLVTLSMVLEHTGIYLGNGHVAELSGKGAVQIVSLTRFVNGDADNGLRFRTGTRIFAACDARTHRPLASQTAADVARKAVDQEMRCAYDVMGSNCHQFVAACVKGIAPNDGRFPHTLGSGLATIDKLEKLLSANLNQGKKMSWCAVARSRERFHYRLTEEKLMRLRLEGVL